MDINSVGFENGAVIVTIMGLKSGMYLAAMDNSSQEWLYFYSINYDNISFTQIGHIQYVITVDNHKKGICNKK